MLTLWLFSTVATIDADDRPISLQFPYNSYGKSSTCAIWMVVGIASLSSKRTNRTQNTMFADFSICCCRPVSNYQSHNPPFTYLKPTVADLWGVSPTTSLLGGWQRFGAASWKRYFRSISSRSSFSTATSQTSCLKLWRLDNEIISEYSIYL